MRQKRESILSFTGNDDDFPKTVREYGEKYKGISLALDLVPKILDLVHRDLLKLTEGGRDGVAGGFLVGNIVASVGRDDGGRAFLS